jgi:transposase
MLELVGARRLYVSLSSTDMRCGRYRLASQIQNELGKDPLSGDLFLFFNKRGTSMKALYFDRDGYVVFHKLLERGTFSIPIKMEISLAELACLLEGIVIRSYSQKKRYKLDKR